MSKNNHGGARPGAGRPKGASDFRKLFNNVVSEAEKEALIIKLLEIAKMTKTKINSMRLKNCWRLAQVKLRTQYNSK